MSLHRQIQTSSSLPDTISSGSTPSRSSSAERASHPNITTRHLHHHHSASAPPSFATRMDSDGFTSNSSSPSSSTLVSLEDEKATSSPSPATKTTATSSTKTKKESKDPPSASKHDKRKEERSCLVFNWSYRNIYSSGSSHGRKAVGGDSGSIGACVLM